MTTTAPAAGWRNRITGSGEEAPDQLLANPANWRIHPKAQQDALAGALDAVGWVQQVLVNRRTGFVVDGHARVALALSRGEPTVPVLYVDLASDEEALVLATLDPIGAMAGRDDEKLKALLADVTVDDAGLLALLGDLVGSEPKAGLTDPDEVPEPPEEPYVKPGELYRLGDHQILCGNATDPDAVARLLDGAAPTLLATDPPYGVQLDQTWRDGVYNGPRKRVKGWGVVAGAAKPYMMAEVPDEAPTPKAKRGHHTAGHRNTSISMDVRADWSEAYALVPSLQVGYVWYASIHTLEVLSGLERIGFELAGQIIWDKGLFSVGRSWYHWAHEPCVVVRRPGVPHLFIGERDQSTIWRAPSPKRIGGGSKEQKEDHPTQKPVLLSEIPIRNHLRPGEAVYEPFSGSGTTLMAAETIGRRCYAMEIDPKYVQVAIERWQRFTGGRRSASMGRRGPAPTPTKVKRLLGGTTQSAWLRYDGSRPQGFGITANDVLVRALRSGGLPDVVVIEKVESYGMVVGAEVFDTMLWAGRFAEAAHRVPVVMLPRRAVKLALCGDSRAKDSNIRQALLDRFGGSAAVGRKAAPGPLYGIARDVWSALAIAVTYTIQSAN